MRIIPWEEPSTRTISTKDPSGNILNTVMNLIIIDKHLLYLMIQCILPIFPTVLINILAGTCVNTDDVSTDIDGDSCNYFIDCDGDGDDQDFNAKTMCCVCGGGRMTG